MSNRILIVDDDRVARSFLFGLLVGSYEVTAAACGEEALDIAARWAPDLVLLDILMPGIDGFETCRALRATPLGGTMQIIVASAASSREEQLRAFELGADAYLVKPIDACTLRSTVRLHFRLRDAVQQVSSIEGEIREERRKFEHLVEERSRQLVATQDVAVFALAKVAESRDEDTGEHMNRVRNYAHLLGQQLMQAGPYRREITRRFLNDLYRSSPLHDIGKVGISDTILLKPGRLTAAEFEVVKTHTVLGANILEEVVLHSQSGGFLAMAARIARSHHERFDGSGYPDRLAGEAIPLAARIVAVADVFDALTTRRPYKGQVPLEEARRIIVDERGRQFDPAVVDAFESRFDGFVAIYERLGEQCKGIPLPAAPLPPANLPAPSMVELC